MRHTGKILLLLALAAGAAGYFFLSNRPLEVRTVEVRRGRAAEIVYASGVVEPVQWAKVSSVLRERIVEVCNCEGQTVAPEDQLAKLDTSEPLAALRELEAKAAFARQELRRIVELYGTGTTTRQVYDKAAADVQAAEAAVASQQARLADYTIRSPIAGVVLRRDAEVGEIAEPGAILFWVGQPTPLQIVAEINEEDIPKVASGQRALLRADAFPQKALEATVSRITPKGDPVLKTYRVYLALPADTPLLIGMSVDVNVVIRTVDDTLIVPTTALVDSAVFRVADNNRAERVGVRTGIMSATAAQIVEGLAEGDRVIAPVPEGLADGARVSAARQD
ncbi:MAG: efflux RND transporter periplasmic adaptor subunit [Rhodobiaceae bacterium]|nr:efflux RND transporter periplasmic adaptor subunit [Rhodobiaceae bacterium]